MTYAIPRKDVKPLAKAMLKRFGGLTGVLDARQQEVEAVKGLGPISATLIRLVKELCGEYLDEKMKHKDVLSSPQGVGDFAHVKLAGLPHSSMAYHAAGLILVHNHPSGHPEPSEERRTSASPAQLLRLHAL